MIIAIYKGIEYASAHYHSGGGAAIIAADLEAAAASLRAAQMANYEQVAHVNPDMALSPPLCAPPPDLVIEATGAAEPQVIMFPDKGCC